MLEFEILSPLKIVILCIHIKKPAIVRDYHDYHGTGKILFLEGGGGEHSQNVTYVYYILFDTTDIFE